MKTLLFMAMLLAGVQAATAQGSMLDSLYRELEKHPASDSNRVNLLVSICYHEYTSKPAQNKLHADEALAISNNIQFHKGTCLATKYIALYYLSLNDYEPATANAYAMLNLAERVNYQYGVGSAHQLLGLLKESQGDLENARNHYLKALTIYQAVNSMIDIASAYNRLGAMSYYAGYYSKKLDSAFIYHFKARDIREKIKDQDGLNQSYTNIAQVYLALDKYNDALAWFSKSRTILEKLDNKYWLAVTLEGMSATYLKLGDEKKGESLLLQAIALSKQTHHKNNLRICYGELAELKKAQSDFRAALDYYTIASAYRDSVSSEKKDKKIAEIEALYEGSKKDQIIQALENDNHVRTIWTRWLTATLIVVVALAATGYAFQKQNEKKNRLILNMEIDQLTTRTRDLEKFHNVLTLGDKNLIDSHDQRLLKRSIEIVEKNISDSAFSVDAMARDLGMSRSNLHRKLKSITGFPPNELIRSIRLRRAAILLLKKTDSISQISISVGFDDHSYFSRAFRKQFGVSPSEYQETGLAGREI
jgi:AraC-like DNA-binding protein/tetratricopeptide (TPR) repeat protein